MPGRSPHHRSTPPPPLISRFSPRRSRVRSPVASSSRDTPRRGEYRPTVRTMRSPVGSKRHSYSPPIKRKRSPPSSPIPEREISRRHKISKSPVGSRDRARGGSELRYKGPAVESDSRLTRNVSGSDRFGDREYEDHKERVTGPPHFRGPEGSIDFKMEDLKKFTIEIVKNSSSQHRNSSINTEIINIDEIAPVRRPDEGSRPLFLRLQSSGKDRSRPDEYQRIVTENHHISRGSGGRNRAHSRESSPASYSPRPGPSRYEDHRRPHYPDRERAQSPYEARHRSPYRDEYVERRDKHRDRRGGSREYTKRDLDGRKIEERRYSPERRPSYEKDHRERGSDLRSRINEKRSDPIPHARIEEGERERRYKSEVERHGRPRQFSPPNERRRPAFPERHEGLRDQRETWEQDREREGRDRASMHQTQYEPPAFSSRYDESQRPSSSHNPDYEPKKFFKRFEPKEFIPPPIRGRGLLSRRALPPNLRGRGLGRGMQRGFRGGMMVPRGMSRGAPFAQPRGFVPRKY